MSRTRRIVVHACLVAGFSSFGFIFTRMGVGSPAPGLMHAAAIACFLVAVGFAVRLTAIARGHSPASAIASAAPAGGGMTRDWRTWGLAAWAAVCLAASLGELLGDGSAEARHVLSPLSMTLLIALFAWQAFRTMKLEQRSQSS